MAFDYQGARQAGYTDAEIVRHLAPNAKFDVEGALQAGYKAEDILSHIGGDTPADGPKDTGFVGAVQQGAANVVGGLGETAEQYIGKGAVSDALKSARDAVAPDNYEQARLYSDKEGFTPSEAPRVIAENAPQMAASMAAYKAGSRIHPIAGGLAAAAAYMAMTRGDEAKRSADARTGTPGAVPTAEDKARAIAYGIPESALAAIGAGRLVSPGALRSVGTRGVVESGKQAGKTLAIEGAVNAGQDTVAEVGRTIGTDGGVKLPASEDLINSALSGAATASPWAGARAARSASEAVQNRAFSGPEATEVANRIARSEENLGGIGGTKRAATAVRNVTSDLHTELSTAVKQARDSGEMGADTALDNALVRVSKGEKLTKHDLGALADVPDNIKSLAKQVTVLAKLKERNGGTADNFTGGVSAAMDRGIRAVKYPVGASAGAALGVAGLAGQAAMFGSAALPTLGAIGGGYVAARMLDRAMGARNPVQSFVRRFADGNSPADTLARPPAPPSDEPRARGPWDAPIPQPQVGTFGKGARPPEPGPQPWGPWNMPPSPQVGTFGKGPRPPEAPPVEEPINPRSEMIVEDGVRKIAKQIEKDRQSQITTAERALRKLAKKDKASAKENDIPAFLPVRGAMDIPAFLPKREPVSPAQVAAPVSTAPAGPSLPPLPDMPELAPVRARAKLAAIPQEAPASVTEAEPKVKALKAKTKVQPKAVETAKAEPAKVDDLDIPAFLDRRNKPDLKPVQPDGPAPKAEEKPATKARYEPSPEKVKFKTVPGDEKFVFHDKHDLDPKSAAEAIADQWEKDGRRFWQSREAFVDSVSNSIDKKYKLVPALTAALPKVEDGKLRSQLLAVSSFEEAVSYRNHLLTQATTKKAKAAIENALSDAALGAIWKRPKAKKK